MSETGNLLGSVGVAVPDHVGDRPILPVPHLGLGERSRTRSGSAHAAGQADPGGDAEFGGKGARLVNHHVPLIGLRRRLLASLSDAMSFSPEAPAADRAITPSLAVHPLDLDRVRTQTP